jgi:DNA ligase (NAD+)
MDDLQRIEGIGPNIALAVVDWFKRETNKNLLLKLHSAGVWPEESKSRLEISPPNIFSDIIFVITGTIEGYSREELKELIQRNGGKVVDSVSKNTNYLIVGENPGSKFEKAQKLGIKIISKSEFNELLKI